jgi:2,3,4,5-tetrahydropyridine-2-carboxylate N-succinyltransferase
VSFRELAAQIEAWHALPADALGDEARAAFDRLMAALESGEVRAAEPGPDGWTVNTWVKKGILLGFRLGRLVETPPAGPLRFFDNDTFLPRQLSLADGVRLIPGGSAIRSGAHVARGVVVVPPAYVNVGAYVGEGSMVDSHALVGSCAQVGRRVHLSAGAMIGGVLEPVGAVPVIIEDEVLVGGNCGVYEGAIVKRRAVLASGTILTRSTPIYDVPNARIITPTADGPLVVPEGAVIVPGSRPMTSGAGHEWGLSLATPIIVKYRDERTDARTALEDAIR